MKLIVGLGNPGPKYEHTRHNAGVRAVRAFHTLHIEEFDGWRDKFESLVSEGRIGDEKVVLLLPQTFMNESGRAVRAAVDFWEIAPADVLAVSDDLDLPVGALRLRRDGSAGGHNGLKSIFQHLGTEDVARLRLGIAGEHAERMPAEKYVLERFPADEAATLAPTLQRAVETLDMTLDLGLETAMNRFN
ncbi:aminoacyl-tRNA hydrolase [Patescibacteria group bacterium]